MVAVYPGLHKIIPAEARALPLLDMMIRYSIMIYDPKSPLVADERDLNYRKNLALDFLKVQDQSVRDQMISCEQPFLPEVITGILQHFIKSMEWACLSALEFKFWEAINITMQPLSGLSGKEQLEALQKKALASKEMEADMKRIEQYYKSLFSDDGDLEKKARSRVSPESVAVM